MMSTIALRCLVSGDGKEKVFTVKIASNDDVSILKDMIKEKVPLYAGIAAKDMQLFKVSLPVANAEQARDPGKIRGAEKLSSPIDEISDVFWYPQKGHIHVVVLAPPVTLTTPLYNFACYYPGETPYFLTVSVKPDVHIDGLVDAIRQKLRARGKKFRPNDELTVYKTDILMMPEDDLAPRALKFLSKHSEFKSTALNLMQRVGAVFDHDCHQDDRVDILIADSEVLDRVQYLDCPCTLQ
ncbi:hypothetical protein FA15DRAFT_697628 [Coprinopsis marcescibilis]|uniref:Crinkler effector protein N-terminal domain-containing protein n=1 Tax=Coprinopsis marcescibilis TaxID=230819 RepID=A0A5C3KH39_COPMA|nr:hypothetical protein FA15DRAFT_697628 [Coprinopsis marcescibilis]